jgi:hypothetical protein
MAIQIIEENRKPSFSEKLNMGLKAGARELNKFSENHQKNRQAQQENEALKLMGIDISGIHDPKMREKAVDFAHQMGLQKDKYQRENELLKGKGPSTEDKKFNKVIEDEKRVKQTAQNSFNSLSRILNKNNIGYGSEVWGQLSGGETLRDTGEFQSATGGLEAMLVDMVNRGTLSNSRFEYITKNLLPTSTDRQEIIKGKLKGLAELLNLDPSALLGETNNFDDVESTNSSKVLDADAMEKIYELSGGDKNEAKRIARKMGYKIE